MAITKKNSYKKYYIIGAILLVPLLIGIMSAFFQKPPTQVSKTNQTIAEVTAISPQTASYTHADYKLTYPKDWKETTQSVVGGNGLITLFEPNTSSTSKSPHFAIQTMDETQASIPTMSKRYKALGFTEEDTTIAGVSAKKLSGSLQTSKGVLHSVTYFFSHKGKIYIIKSGYMWDTVDQPLEEQFNQTIESLTLD